MSKVELRLLYDITKGGYPVPLDIQSEYNKKYHLDIATRFIATADGWRVTPREIYSCTCEYVKAQEALLSFLDHYIVFIEWR